MSSGRNGWPEQPRWGLVVPFVVCASKGGPYDDESFTAGFQAGRLDAHLRHAAAAGADGLTATARTALVPLLELLGMHHGYPVLTARPVEATDNYPAMPEWSTVAFRAARTGTDPEPGG